MLPIYDNMEYILHEADMRGSTQEYDYNSKGKDKQKGKRRYEKQLTTLDGLIHHGKVSLEAITYMRGRSIPYQYILIDEVQNLTPHEVKTLISRVGEGSKIVLAGDPYQIDSPYLDFSSNGLIVASNKFKGYPIFGTIYLENSERSELSKLVSTVW
jgi:PhoH-like ATPase